jgi:hypothetical protein
LIKPYFSKFYEIVNEVVEKKDRELAEVFLRLSPYFNATEEDEA